MRERVKEMRRVLWEGECTKCHLGTAAIPEWSVYSLDNWESGRCLTGGLRVVQRWVFSQEYFKIPQASEHHWCWLSPQAENSIANMTQSSLKMDLFQFDAIRTFQIQPRKQWENSSSVFGEQQRLISHSKQEHKPWYLELHLTTHSSFSHEEHLILAKAAAGDGGDEGRERETDGGRDVLSVSMTPYFKTSGMSSSQNLCT